MCIVLFQTWGGYTDHSLLPLMWSTNYEMTVKKRLFSKISNFCHVLNVTFFFMGYLPTSELYFLTFRVTLYVPSSWAV
jgi:hypothetical protein